MYKNKLKILVAEDNGVMRALLGHILTDLGFTNILYASDGAKAVNLAAQAGPHIAFLDVDMPEKSGIEVTKELLRGNPKCHCVMVSARNEAACVKAAVEAGARGFIVKPYSPQRIRGILAEFAAARRAVTLPAAGTAT